MRCRYDCQEDKNDEWRGNKGRRVRKKVVGDDRNPEANGKRHCGRSHTLLNKGWNCSHERKKKEEIRHRDSSWSSFLRNNDNNKDRRRYETQYLLLWHFKISGIWKLEGICLIKYSEASVTTCFCLVSLNVSKVVCTYTFSQTIRRKSFLFCLPIFQTCLSLQLQRKKCNRLYCIHES